MTIAQIRDGIRDAVDGISSTNLRAVGYVFEKIQPPMAVVAFDGMDYDLVMGRGADTYRFLVTVYAGRTSEEAAQKFLDLLCEPSGTGSLKTVVEADATLAGFVDYVRVVSVSGVQVASVGATEFLLVEFSLEVVV